MALALFALSLLLLPVSAAAQCAMCRAAVEDAGGTTARTMNLGIVVLLFPPVVAFCSIFAAAWKASKGEEDEP